MHYFAQWFRPNFLSIFRCFWPKTKNCTCVWGTSAPDTKQENCFKATNKNMCVLCEVDVVRRRQRVRGVSEKRTFSICCCHGWNAIIFFFRGKCWTIFKLFLMDSCCCCWCLKHNACHIRGASAQRLGLLIFLSHLMWLMFRSTHFLFQVTFCMHTYGMWDAFNCARTSGAVEFHTPFFCYLLSIIIANVFVVVVVVVVVTIWV